MSDESNLEKLIEYLLDKGIGSSNNTLVEVTALLKLKELGFLDMKRNEAGNIVLHLNLDEVSAATALHILKTLEKKDDK